MALNFLELIIGKNYQYQSKLDKNSFILKLKDLVDEKSEKGILKKKPFIGKIYDNRFIICENVLLLQAFSTFLDARVQENTDGCKILGRFRINRWITIFIGFFLIFLMSLSLFFVYLTGMDELIDLMMFIPVLIFLLIFLMVFIAVSQETNRMEELVHNKINF